MNLYFLTIGFAFSEKRVVIFFILIGVMYLAGNRLFNLIMLILPSLNISYSFLLFPILVGGFLWQFALLCHKPLEMDQRTGLMVMLMLVALIFNLLGNIIYLPQYGVIATAYTYIASATVYILSNIYFSWKKFKMIFKLS